MKIEKMTPFQPLRILLLTFSLITIVSCSCKADPKYTVENANSYIEKNKDTINQTYREIYHAMAPIGWMSYASGFVFFQGEYHLFYQYNPYGTFGPNATNIHWGHKKSKDLFRWEDLPVALAPDQIYDRQGVYSGSAIEKDGRLYIMYTGNTGRKQVQCIAISEDGIHFEKIKQNPVLHKKDLPPNSQPETFKNPKVFKHDDTYFAVIASKTDEDTGQVLLYQSDDLIVWQYKSVLLKGTKDQGDMWECPDLFELDGKDVLLISARHVPRSGNDYINLNSVIVFIGEVDWDKGIFKVESMKELDHGMDFYATQTTSDNQGRRILTGWMNMWGRSYPTADLDHGWVGTMGIPVELNIKDGVLVQKSLPEIEKYYKRVSSLQTIALRDSISQFYGISGEVGELIVEVNLKEAELFEIHLRTDQLDEEHVIIAYNISSNEITLDRSKSGILITGEENPQVTSRSVVTPLVDDKLKLQVFLDTSSIEVFVNDGSESFVATFYTTNKESPDIFFIVEGTAKFEKTVFNSY